MDDALVKKESLKLSGRGLEYFEVYAFVLPLTSPEHQVF